MAVSVFDSALWGQLFADDEVTRLFSDSAEIRAMLMVEGALARAQGEAGMIPPETAEAIGRAAVEAALDPAALRAQTKATGLPVPGLVEAFRAAIPSDAGAWAHYGATSQDIVDTGLVLRLRRVLEIYDARLRTLTQTLAEAATRWRALPMAARTRHRIATPTSFGARIAAWGMPMLRHRDRIAEVRPRLLVVSLGGASGTLSAMGAKGVEVVDRTAALLDLGAPSVPWHSARDTMAELAGLAGMIAGTLGKIGVDLVALGANEVAEVRAGAGGGSSTMPQKENPVAAETLVALARHAAAMVGAAHQAQIHDGERDGAAWAQEWLALPQLLSATGAALILAEELARTLRPDEAAMLRNVNADHSTAFAEAATFALAAHMRRPDAQALVKRAVAETLRAGRPLRDTLEAATAAPVDWARVFDPAVQCGLAPVFADRFAMSVTRAG